MRRSRWRRAARRQSCYACHSNETDWPPYSYAAPMSWLVRWDVGRGREELNFSEWDLEGGEADDAAERVLDRTMPLDRYTLIHRDAGLSDAEVDTLVAALLAMDEDEDGGGEGGDGGGDDGDDGD